MSKQLSLFSVTVVRPDKGVQRLELALHVLKACESLRFELGQKTCHRCKRSALSFWMRSDPIPSREHAELALCRRRDTEGHSPRPCTGGSTIPGEGASLYKIATTNRPRSPQHEMPLLQRRPRARTRQWGDPRAVRAVRWRVCRPSGARSAPVGARVVALSRTVSSVAARRYAVAVLEARVTRCALPRGIHANGRAVVVGLIVAGARSAVQALRLDRSVDVAGRGVAVRIDLRDKPFMTSPFPCRVRRTDHVQAPSHAAIRARTRTRGGCVCVAMCQGRVAAS